jgi:hypothetical protein
MADWTLIVAGGAGLLLVLAWIGLEDQRRHWKRAARRRHCPHVAPCLDGRYRGRDPGWAREVYYCPDCKHLWARRVSVTLDEWERLSEREPAPYCRADEG